MAQLRCGIGKPSVVSVIAARIFTDKLSGAQVERPGLKEALSQLREADTLVVWKLDRLGRVRERIGGPGQ